MRRRGRTAWVSLLLLGLALDGATVSVAWAVPGHCKPGSKKKGGTPPPKKGKPPPEPEPPPAAPASDVVPNTQFRGPTRIDFDDRLIQGQTNKSGAVYLFDRKETGIDSMVRRRKSFKQLTIATIYDR